MANALERFFTLWCEFRFHEAIDLLRHEDFRNFQNADELKDRWLHAHNSQYVTRVSSSGSSGNRTMYEFGPMPGLVEIEHLIKDTKRTTLMLLGGETNEMCPSRSVLFKNAYQFNYDNPSFDEVRRYFGPGTGNLYCRPDVLLFLSREYKFMKLLEEGCINSLISTDWEPFYDEEIFKPYTHVNDNMASWKHGHVFMTCRAYRKHALPFCINNGEKSANLLNLANKNFYQNDDTLVLSTKSCECGLRWPIVQNFENHTGNTFRPFMELRKRLVGQYVNCQFIRNWAGQVEWHATTKDWKIPKQDQAAVEKTYGQVFTIRNFRIPAGIKYPNFWSFINQFPRELVKKPKLKML